MLTLGVVALAVLLISGVPLFIAFALGGLIIILFVAGLPPYNLAMFFFDSMNNWVLLAIPLFILAGELTVHSGMGEALVDLLKLIIGRVPGSIAVSAIIVSAFVGAFTGVTFAVLGTVGLVLFPAMVAAKYNRDYSAGVLAASAQLGILIPPSVVFIIYGYLTNTSVAQLFMAGIVPGILLAGLLSVTAIFIAYKRKFPIEVGVSLEKRKAILIKALPAIFMPVIVLGGIYGGVFTPTEAAAVACLYTLVVGAFIYRRLNFKNIWASSLETARILSMIMILLCGVLLFNRALILIGLPQAIGKWAVVSGVSPLTFILMVCIGFIVLGLFMDAFGMVAVIPTILPALGILDINPVHLGVLFVVASGIGCLTPPAAGFLYFAGKLFDVPTVEMLRGVWPFLLIMIICLLILAFVPEISLWLPGTMFAIK